MGSKAELSRTSSWLRIFLPNLICVYWVFTLVSLLLVCTSCTTVDATPQNENNEISNSIIDYQDQGTQTPVELSLDDPSLIENDVMDKRSGTFYGLRGKKDSSSDESSPKRSTFYGLRGKKENKVFYGLRGKKTYDPQSDMVRQDRSTFYGLRGKKIPYEPDEIWNPVPYNNRGVMGLAAARALGWKRGDSPLTFYGLRGRREKSSDGNGKTFYGLRGKRNNHKVSIKT